MPLTYHYDGRKVHELVSLFQAGKLNLEPGFQRESVWSLTDRRKLLQSILSGYPLPSIFLYERQDDRGRLVYDVIDGKQRLESILMFQGVGRFRGKRFAIRAQIPATDGELAEWTWRRLEGKRLQRLLDSSSIQTVEVSGDLSDVIDLFVRINSTGKRLTGQERRHARFYRNPFLKEAQKIAERYTEYFAYHRILTSAQVTRMKHVELTAELMASIHSGGLINKKTTLDSLLGSDKFDLRSLPRAVSETKRILNLVDRMFPNLRTTRFANSADFYSLFMLVWAMGKDGSVLADRARNRQAEKLLIWLSAGVGAVRDRVRKAEGARPDERLFRDYLLTIQGDTDSQANRKRRADILREVFGGLFERKDEKRGFSKEQRRLIWHSDEARRCTSCRQALTWENFTIDHIKPYVLGGRATLTNAAIMCRACNSRKGGRPKAGSRRSRSSGRRRATQRTRRPSTRRKVVRRGRRPGARRKTSSRARPARRA